MIAYKNDKNDCRIRMIASSFYLAKLKNIAGRLLEQLRNRLACRIKQIETSLEKSFHGHLKNFNSIIGNFFVCKKYLQRRGSKLSLA